MMRCIHRKERDPYFNLAAEEHLLQAALTDTFMVWQNDASVIIGKHQNTAREINHQLTQKANIPVIRRVTGGGTVYHDPGNINFSFIRLNRKENPIDFKFFTQPIIIFLQSMGLPAEFEGKSNISINGFKVSGNSAHVHKGRVLHHGTLLFNADLEMLENIIDSKEERYDDRSVKSIRRQVTNIASLLTARMEVHDFIESFFSFIINYYTDSFNDDLKEAEYEAIQKLALEKYINPSWNYGYSPDYLFSELWESEFGSFKVSMNVREGNIDSIEFTGPAEYSTLMKSAEKMLQGILHERISVTKQLKKLKFVSGNDSQVINQLIDHLF